MTSKQVGDISEVMSGGNVLANPALQKTEGNVGVTLDALPPMLRMDIDTKYKVLHTDDKQHSLSGYNTFLAVSDRMFREYYEFFLQPHIFIKFHIHRISFIMNSFSNPIRRELFGVCIRLSIFLLMSLVI